MIGLLGALASFSQTGYKMIKNKNLHGFHLSRRAALAAVAVSAAALFAFAAPAPSFAEDKSIKVGIMAGE